jgi:hypothetical protein
MTQTRPISSLRSPVECLTHAPQFYLEHKLYRFTDPSVGSVIPSSLVKHRCYHARYEIDQIGACRCVHWHGAAFL